VKRRITILRKTPTLTPQLMTKFLFIITNKNSFCSICLLCLRLIVASEQENLSNICHRCSKMRIREFQEKDQNAAFEIWKHGMLVDLKSSWRSWILSQIHVNRTPSAGAKLAPGGCFSHFVTEPVELE
jgi:hypothetical protein